MSAATAIQSVTRPKGTRSTTMPLTSSEATTFWRMIRTAGVRGAIAAGRRVRSSLIRATSAESSAIALPAAPIATPTRAAARAGASLMPSPTIATAPGLLEVANASELVLGQQRGVPLADADAAGDVARDGVVVAGEHDDPLDAGSAQAATAVAASGRGSSRARTRPAGGLLAERDHGLAVRLDLGDARRARGAEALGGEARAAGPERAPLEQCVDAASGKRRQVIGGRRG